MYSVKPEDTIFTCTDNRKIPSISYRATFFIIRVSIKLNLLHAFRFLELAKVLLGCCGKIEKKCVSIKKYKNISLLSLLDLRNFACYVAIRDGTS